MDKILPREIRRAGEEGLEITWNDGTFSRLSSKVLRENCPSAVSRAKRGDDSHEKPLGSKKGKGLLRVIESSLDQELRLETIWSVGNYAIGIRWGDGHDTGIYPFTLLYELSRRE